VKAARRKFVAPQIVIVSDRRSRKPNDLKSGSERLIASCQLLAAFFKDPAHFGAVVL
jgi:hypothetical protein